MMGSQFGDYRRELYSSYSSFYEYVWVDIPDPPPLGGSVLGGSVAATDIQYDIQYNI